MQYMYPIQATRLNTTTTEDGRQSTLESIKVVVVMLELAAVVPAAVSLFGKVYRVHPVCHSVCHPVCCPVCHPVCHYLVCHHPVCHHPAYVPSPCVSVCVNCFVKLSDPVRTNNKKQVLIIIVY